MTGWVIALLACSVVSTKNVFLPSFGLSKHYDEALERLCLKEIHFCCHALYTFNPGATLHASCLRGRAGSVFMIRQKMGTSHWALICFCWVGLWRFAEVMHMCSLLTLYCSGSWTVWFKCCRAFRSAAVRFTPWTVGLLFYRFTFFCFPRNPQFLFFVPDQRFGNSLNDVNPSECETPQYSWWRRVRKNTCHLNSLVLLISRFWGKSCSMCSRIWAVWFLPASHLISNHDVRFLIIF